MSLEVLCQQDEVRLARAELRARGLSCADGWLATAASRLRLRRKPLVGDVRKSWDVLRTARFIEQHVGKDDLVLDIGARGSEMLPILDRMGYRRLVGIDLDPSVTAMPSSDRVDYRVGDFMRTGLDSGSCAAITAISVIEHGYNADGLFREVGRLLQPGGGFVASFDYWPAKLNTEAVTLFGMSWRIFSTADVQQLVQDACRYGLEPWGALRPKATGPLVHFEGRDYTFAWLALRKV